MTKEKIKSLISGLKTEKSILKALEKNNVNYEVDTLSDYFNIKIPVEDGVIRIYKSHRKELVVQKMTMCKFEYSGIPVFFE